MMIYNSDLFFEALNQIISNALYEDVRGGDYTSLACIEEKAQGKAQLIMKDAGHISGIAFAQHFFSIIDDTLEFEAYKKDGDFCNKGESVFCVFGSIHSILKSERIVLNVMQRMSAITTKTIKLNNIIKNTSSKVLDTRKTTPNIRLLEKWAVHIGGGVNHRFGLYDEILIKDNHIDFSGDIVKAIEKANLYIKNKGLDINILVEARSLLEVESIIKAKGVDRILLDNFDIETTKEALVIIAGQLSTESSGNIDEHNILDYAMTGVDFISCGALTHSVKSIDMSLKATTQ